MSWAVYGAQPGGATTSTLADPDAGHATFGDHVRVDVAIYFAEDVTTGELSEFSWNELTMVVPGRRGRDHLPGVQYTGVDYDRRAIYVTFFRECVRGRAQFSRRPRATGADKLTEWRSTLSLLTLDSWQPERTV